jgi:hypothetical protein
MIRDL